jgi:hypothetical protein
MRAGPSWRSRRLGALTAGLAVAIMALSLAASSSHALSSTKPRPGSSCAHPLRSSEAVDGFPGQHSDTRDFSVKVNQVHDPEPGTSAPMTLQLIVTIHNLRIEICRAVISSVTPDNQHISEHPVRISPHGGASSTVTIPANHAFAGIAYARLR